LALDGEAGRTVLVLILKLRMILKFMNIAADARRAADGATTMKSPRHVPLATLLLALAAPAAALAQPAIDVPPADAAAPAAAALPRETQI
jgi:hypothetical protein